MILVVGLGNPGRRYRETRHNLGFEVVEALSREKKEEGRWRRVRQAEVFDYSPGVRLVKPVAFMNRSGPPVARLVQKEGVELKDVWVVHDDLDLGLGKIRVVQGRGAGGHNGVFSLIQALGTEFYRVRLGIGRPSFGRPIEGSKKYSKFLGRQSVEKFVLSPFLAQEQDEKKTLVERAVALLEEGLREGLAKAASRRAG